MQKCALDLDSSKMLVKLAGGDMVATYAEYHANCLIIFYKAHSKLLKQSNDSTLISNIEEARYEQEKPVFKLA